MSDWVSELADAKEEQLGFIASERLGGNIVKEEFHKGALFGLRLAEGILSAHVIKERPANVLQQANGAEPSEIISLCIGCLKENCSQRSELKCCPVTICAMRQAK